MVSRTPNLNLLTLTLAAVFILAGVLQFRVAAQAQTATANLSGIVVDETGAVVPNVSIVAMNTATGLERQAVTNAEGYFFIPLLSVGNYTLTAEMPGFATVTINDIALRDGVNSSLQVILRPGTITDSIDVISHGSAKAVRAPLDITNATTSFSVTNNQVVSLPVLTTTLGRNTLGVLSFTVPGVSPATSLGAAQPDANRLGNHMSINGSRPSSVSFNLEGGDNNDYEYNQAIAPLPNPDALQELTIITSGYQADQGRSSGGIISAVAKSGTSHYRGNVRYFLVNEAFNARGFFDPKTPRDRLNTFGGQIGGPLFAPGLFPHNGRTFLFFDYEGTRSSLEALSTSVLPTNRERDGDFGASLPKPLQPGSKTPFKHAVIPPSLINGISQIYLDRFIPRPNDGERNFRRLLPTAFRNDQFTARLDHKISSGNDLNLTFFSNLSFTASETANFPVGSKKTVRGNNYNLVLREAHVFSGQMVNQVTVALTRFENDEMLDAPGASRVAPSEIGFTGIHPQTVQFLGVPSLSISGTDIRVVTGDGSINAKTTWQAKDDLLWKHNDHGLKFGAETRSYFQNSSLASNNGSFIFSGTLPGTHNPIADFLLGFPSVYIQTSGSSRYPRQRAFYCYAMDDWHLRPNLTVNMGVRYELASTLKDKLDQVSAFRPGIRSERFPDAPLGLLFPGDSDPVLGTVPRGGYPTDKNNLAPRLGFAYSPKPKWGWARLLFGEGQSAIRGAWGVFYDQTFGYSFTRVASTEPFSVSQFVISNEIYAGGGSFANPFGRRANPWPVSREKTVFSTNPQVHPFDPAFRSAYSYQYNLTIQRQLPWAMLLELAYIGSAGRELARERELNIAVITRTANFSNVQKRRTYPDLGSILSQESTGRARYDSLQIRLTRGFKTGLRFDAAYVFGKSLDDGSGPLYQSATDPFRWARSSFDRKQGLVSSFTYAVPALKAPAAVRVLTRGWRVAGIAEFRTGLPLDIYQSIDTTLSGTHSVGNPDFVGNYKRFDPRKTRTFTVNGATVSGNFFFNPAAFRPVPVGDFRSARAGTLGRNVFEAPGINLLSFSLIKQIRFSESRSLTLRADVRNLFNHALFQLQSSTIEADRPSFGQALSAAPGRNVQVSLRFTF